MNEKCKSKVADTLPWIIIFGVEALIIILGNIVTIVVFWKKRFYLRQTSFVLINLSIADLMVGVNTIESRIQEILSLSSASCKTNWTNYLVLEEFFGCASISFLVLISLERLYAIVWPFRSRTTSTRKYIYAIGIVWLLSAIAPVLQLLKGSAKLPNEVYIWYGTTYLSVCLITTLIAYSVIWFFSIKKDPRLPQNRHKRNKELAKTLFIVTLFSLITWLPITVLLRTTYIYNVVGRVSRFLQLANSFINPVIYCFRMPMFRQILRNMFIMRKTSDLNIRRKEICSRRNAVVLVTFSYFNINCNNVTRS